MRGETKLKILEFLKDSSRSIRDIFLVFAIPYGTSLGRGLKLVEKYHQERENREIDRKERLRFNDFLYRLKKEGLVEEIEKKNKKLFQLTARGKEKLNELRFKKSTFLPSKEYKIEKANLLKIIIFDIPENKKKKRDWLRDVLRNLDFYMLQKSVWAGQIKLPEEFIRQLKELNILQYIEIFEISKTGSLKQFKPPAS